MHEWVHFKGTWIDISFFLLKFIRTFWTKAGKPFLERYMPVFWFAKRFSVSMKGVVCVWEWVCVCKRESCGAIVCLPCPCRRPMSHPLRGWHWTAVPFWTIALARVSKAVSSVLCLPPSLAPGTFWWITPPESCFLPDKTCLVAAFCWGYLRLWLLITSCLWEQLTKGRFHPFLCFLIYVSYCRIR